MDFELSDAELAFQNEVVRFLEENRSPDVMDPKDPLAAFEGRKGALLWVVATDSGRRRAEYRLDSPPVFNGMAAADGRLYIATRDGQVLCMARGK